MSEYFQRVANEVLKASEELSVVMEDGISAMFKGDAAVPPKSPETMEGFGVDFEGNEDFEVIEEELMNSPLQGMAESVLGDIMQNQAQPETIREKLDAFRSAITWSEPFIVGLLAFQITMFLLCIVVSRPNTGLPARLTIMVFIAALVRSAEYINAIAGRNWKEFATQNYFDRQGVFFAIMISGPLLFDCLIMLMLFVREASQLLVTVKTNELKRKNKDTFKGRSKKEKAETKKKQ